MSTNDPTTPSGHRPRDEPPDHGFDGALRSWAARPPATPPEEAARHVLARLPAARTGARGPSSRAAGWLVAACLAAVLGAALFVTRSDPGPGSPAPGRDPAPSAAPVAPPGDVLVIELDPETTLYLNLGTGREPASPDPSGDPS